jgi:hypothetical protein
VKYASWMPQQQKGFLCILGERRLERSIQAISEGTKQITGILFICIKSHMHDAETGKTTVCFPKIGPLSHSTKQI